MKVSEYSNANARNGQIFEAICLGAYVNIKLQTTRHKLDYLLVRLLKFKVYELLLCLLALNRRVFGVQSVF
jgi:hypothetical protein